MGCGECGLDIIDGKYYVYKEWKPLDPQHHDPSNIVRFCGPKCSLDWYKKNRNKNEN